MKRLLCRIARWGWAAAVVCGLAAGTARAEKRLSQAQQVERQASLRGTTVERMVDSLVRGRDFQFIPGTLHGQVDGTHAIYKYTPAPDFPLWLMINMGGPLTVNKRLFALNRVEEKVKDGVRVWLLNIGCADSVNGKFDLQFVIEAATGKAMLEVKQTEKGIGVRSEETNRNQDSFLFQGYIFPEYFLYAYKNEKQRERAERTERQIDDRVPRLDFRAGGQTINPALLEREFARLVYLDKHNDTWYVRIEFPATRNRHQKTSVLDFAICAHTAETYVRRGLYDSLYKNWMHYRGSSGFTTSN